MKLPRKIHISAQQLLVLILGAKLSVFSFCWLNIFTKRNFFFNLWKDFLFFPHRNLSSFHAPTFMACYLVHYSYIQLDKVPVPVILVFRFWFLTAVAVKCLVTSWALCTASGCSRSHSPTAHCSISGPHLNGYIVNFTLSLLLKEGTPWAFVSG